MLKLIYSYFVLVQEVIFNWNIYYCVNCVCLYMKHVERCFEVYIRNCCETRWSRDVFWCFATPWSMHIYIRNVTWPPLCKWLPWLSEGRSGMAVYPNHFIICLSPSVPNLMLVSQNAQFLWKFQLRGPATLKFDAVLAAFSFLALGTGHLFWINTNCDAFFCQFLGIGVLLMRVNRQLKHA